MITRNDVIDLLRSRTCSNSSSDPEGLLAEAEAIRCLDQIAGLARVPFGFEALERLHKRVPGSTPGALVLQCLRVYYEHSDDPEKAQLLVYQWLRHLDPKGYPSPEGLRPGAAEHIAANMYADCYLILSEFVAAFNGRGMKVAKCAV